MAIALDCGDTCDDLGPIATLWRHQAAFALPGFKMVECPVKITAGGISVEILALLDVESLEPDAMPRRITGWLKRAFDPAAVTAVLSEAPGKTMWFFEERFNYVLRIENKQTLSFHAIRGEDSGFHDSAATR